MSGKHYLEVIETHKNKLEHFRTLGLYILSIITWCLNTNENYNYKTIKSTQKLAYVTKIILEMIFSLHHTVMLTLGDKTE